MARWILGAVFMTASFFLFVTASQAAGDSDAGRLKSVTCAACHGNNGISAMTGVPNLAGHPDMFLQWQLVFFRSERRKNPAMIAIASQLSDEDVRDLGAYYAALPAKAATAPVDPDPALSARGQEVAAEHHCANCHTESFAGERGAARLAHQRSEYLIKSLHDYRDGDRPSTGVAAMTEASASLSEADMQAIAHYLEFLP